MTFVLEGKGMRGEDMIGEDYSYIHEKLIDLKPSLLKSRSFTLIGKRGILVLTLIADLTTFQLQGLLLSSLLRDVQQRAEQESTSTCLWSEKSERTLG